MSKVHYLIVPVSKSEINQCAAAFKAARDHDAHPSNVSYMLLGSSLFELAQEVINTHDADFAWLGGCVLSKPAKD